MKEHSPKDLSIRRHRSWSKQNLGEKKVKEVQLMRWKISTFTREPLEHGKILQDLKVKSDSDLPGVSVGQDNLGALHMLFVHSPYRQLLSTEQLAPTAPVLLSAALPVAL